MFGNHEAKKWILRDSTRILKTRICVKFGFLYHQKSLGSMGETDISDYLHYLIKEKTLVVQRNYTTNVLTITDERGNVTVEEQDMQGRVWRRIERNGSQIIATEHKYDGLGNEIVTIDPKRNRVVRTYNALNQLEKVEFPRETFQENEKTVTVIPYKRFTYDDAGRQIFEYYNHASGDELYIRNEYDEIGRVIRTATPGSRLQRQKRRFIMMPMGIKSG